MKKPESIEALSKSINYAYKPIIGDVDIFEILLYVSFLESEVERLKREADVR